MSQLRGVQLRLVKLTGSLRVEDTERLLTLFRRLSAQSVQRRFPIAFAGQVITFRPRLSQPYPTEGSTHREH